MAKMVEPERIEYNKSPTDTQAFLSEASRRAEQSFARESVNRREGLEDIAFANGNQWPEAAYNLRHKDNRPCLTIDLISPAINNFIGKFRQNKVDMNVKPTDAMGSSNLAKIYESLIRNINKESNTAALWPQQLQNVCIGGFSDFRILPVYDSAVPIYPNLKIEAVQNPYNVYWDPNSYNPHKTDANFVFIVTSIDKDIYKNMYGDDGDYEGLVTYKYFDIFKSRENSRVITEYFCKEPAKKDFVAMADGSILPKDNILTINAYRSRDVEIVKEYNNVDTYKIMYYKLSNTRILYKAEWPGIYIPVFHVPGYVIQLGNQYSEYGMVRKAKDPQRNYNYWRSAATELVALTPKVPYLVTPEQINGFEAQWDRINTGARPYLLFNGGTPDGKPQREPSTPPPSSEMALGEGAYNDIQSVLGLPYMRNQNQMDGSNADQAPADIGQYILIDNLSIAVRNAGVALIDLIPKTYTTERMLRLLDSEDKATFEPINQLIIDTNSGLPVRTNDLSVGCYDLEVHIGPSLADRKANTAKSMLEVINHAPNMLDLTLDELVDSLDWPGAEKIKARVRRVLLAKGIVPPENDAERQIVQAAAMQAQQNDPTAIRMKELELKDKDITLKDVANQRNSIVEQMKLQVEEKRLAMENDHKTADREVSTAKTVADMSAEHKKIEIGAYDAVSKRLEATIPQVENINVDKSSGSKVKSKVNPSRGKK